MSDLEAVLGKVRLARQILGDTGCDCGPGGDLMCGVCAAAAEIDAALATAPKVLARHEGEAVPIAVRDGLRTMTAEAMFKDACEDGKAWVTPLPVTILILARDEPEEK